MKVLKNVLFWTATALLIISMALLAVTQFSGLEFKTMQTDTMEPEIHQNSLLVIEPVESEKIEVGDDVTFVTEQNETVTSRIIAINRVNNSFVTCGIANGLSNPDAENRFENIIGVVKFCVPSVGPSFEWITSTAGLITRTVIILIIYALAILTAVLHSVESSKRKSSKISGAVLEDPQVFGGDDSVNKTKENTDDAGFHINYNELSDGINSVDEKSAVSKPEKVEKENPKAHDHHTNPAKQKVVINNKKVRITQTDDFWN